jgi:hypothetical protein
MNKQEGAALSKERTSSANPRELSEFFRGAPKKIKVGDKTIAVEYRVAYFAEYAGQHPRSTWNKPVVGPPDRPFAELQLVQRLERDGWTAAWVYRSGRFIGTWEPKSEVNFPTAARELLKKIQRRAGSRAGCWDVFAWKDDKPLFMEVKRRKSSDRIKTSQLTWMKAAIKEGVPESAFQVVEWCGGSLKGRVIRLTSLFGIDVDGWAECRNGELTFGGPSPNSVKSLLNYYKNQGAKSPADLLWLVFRSNSDGRTYCDFEERSAKRRANSASRRSSRRR